MPSTKILTVPVKPLIGLTRNTTVRPLSLVKVMSAGSTSSRKSGASLPPTTSSRTEVLWSSCPISVAVIVIRYEATGVCDVV